MVVTISSWLNFGRPAPPWRGSAAGRNFLAPSYYNQRAVCVASERFFHFSRDSLWLWTSVQCSWSVGHWGWFEVKTGVSCTSVHEDSLQKYPSVVTILTTKCRNELPGICCRKSNMYIRVHFFTAEKQLQLVKYPSNYYRQAKRCSARSHLITAANMYHIGISVMSLSVLVLDTAHLLQTSTEYSSRNE